MKKEEAFEKAHIAEREEAAVTSSNQDLKATPQEEPKPLARIEPMIHMMRGRCLSRMRRRRHLKSRLPREMTL